MISLQKAYGPFSGRWRCIAYEQPASSFSVCGECSEGHGDALRSDKRQLLLVFFLCAVTNIVMFVLTLKGLTQL